MKRTVTASLLLFAIALPSGTLAQPPPDPDPLGIVIKPIPEKLVVLTFDDACASHATFVGPLLKKLGFGATFYITTFGNPAPDPNVYMNWEQIKGLERMGFEIGNHTWSHSQIIGEKVDGSLPDVIKIEELCLANQIARPTTFCWPIYTTSKAFSNMLDERGYLFARSGGRNDRPYRPTLENPFETPSFTMVASTPLETFTSAAKRATRGRIPIYTFHGVPDIEHPGISVEPARFEQMMNFLKDNHYTVIAMRDIARYVDSKKAAKLLPLPEVAPDITITDPADLAAGKTLQGPKAVCETKVAGPQVTFGGSGKGWVAIHAAIDGKRNLIHQAPWLLELHPKTGNNDLSGIAVTGSALQASPQGLNGAPLTLKDATLKLADPMNTWKDFPSPVTLVGSNTVRAIDDHRAVMSGKMTGSGGVTYTGYFALGRISSDSDYSGPTRIAQDEWFVQNGDDRQGHDFFMFGIGGTRPFGTGVVTIAGAVGTRMGPAWGESSLSVIGNPVVLETPLVFSWRTPSSIELAGVVSGPGALVKVFAATDSMPTNKPERPFGSTLRLRGDNTYRGGTRFFSGNLLFDRAGAFGTGVVQLGGKVAGTNHAMILRNQAELTVANAFELAGITDATVDGACPTFGGFRDKCANDPAAPAEFNTTAGDLTLSGSVSGGGGLLKTGDHALILTGKNTYAGPTTVGEGSLHLGNAHSLSPNTEIAVAKGATLELNFKGQAKVRKLVIDGKAQPAGTYRAASSAEVLKGTGELIVAPDKGKP